MTTQHILDVLMDNDESDDEKYSKTPTQSSCAKNDTKNIAIDVTTRLRPTVAGSAIETGYMHKYNLSGQTSPAMARPQPLSPTTGSTSMRARVSLLC
jgi:hypothetical protein